MTVNKYRLSLNSNDKYLNIPIQIKTDLLGRDDLLTEYEDKVIEEVINPIEDFEVTRYAHKDWISENLINTSIEYKFKFFDRSIGVDSTNPSNINLWVSDYVFTENPNFTGTCFNEAEIYYNANSFKRSFFKLDLYDTTNSETQQIYLTIIIPTQQGKVRLSGTQPYSGGGGFVQGPTIPDIMPGGGDFGLSLPIEDEGQNLLQADVNMTFDDSYEAVFYNCNSFSVTKYIEVGVFYDEMNWPQTDYSITVGGVCYELHSVDTSVVIPDPPLQDYINNINEFTVGDCGCLPPTSQTPTPTATPINPPQPTPSLTPTPSPPNTPGCGGGVNPNPPGIGTGATPALSVAPPNVDIKLPDFVLDYIGDKEGYFIYWLKNPNYVNIDTFYMSAKFFNAKTGQFVRMMNTPQSQLSDKFNFDKSTKFYYKVQLDIDNYEYEIRDVESDIRLGTGYPINWYEYVNPS